jgi:hypothetical protein
LNSKLASICRLGAFIVAFYFMIAGKPPAKAQDKPQNVITVVSNKDEQQDIQLGKVEEWHTEQQGWNQLTGSQIAAIIERENKLYESIDSIQGEITGGFALLTLLTGLGVFFQVKKRKE